MFAYEMALFLMRCRVIRVRRRLARMPRWRLRCHDDTPPRRCRATPFTYATLLPCLLLAMMMLPRRRYRFSLFRFRRHMPRCYAPEYRYADR